MASTQQKIQEAASQNATLLAGLHETDSAPSQLAQQTSYIADLDQQIVRSQKKLAELQRKTASELKDHKKYSESTFRRFAHKASGQKEKFAEKAAKEEREYFDAIQAQKTCEDDFNYAKQLRNEAEITRVEYEKNAHRHEQLQGELDALYNSIFAGHTPGFPDEDAKEAQVNAASQRCASISQAMEREKHILHLLQQIAGRLAEAKKQLDSAHGMSQMDLFGGGTFSSMAKRNYLERAESCISSVRMLQDQLRQINPTLADLGPMNIASGSIWGDVVFDNIFSDMDMHNKIKESEIQIQRALQKLSQNVKAAEQNSKTVGADMEQAKGVLSNARVELQKAREQAFERVSRGETIDGDDGTFAPPSGPPPQWTPAQGDAPTDAPPAYSA